MQMVINRFIKRMVRRYYSERFLPDTTSLRKKIEAGSTAMMALDPAAFTTAEVKFTSFNWKSPTTIPFSVS